MTTHSRIVLVITTVLLVVSLIACGGAATAPTVAPAPTTAVTSPTSAAPGSTTKVQVALGFVPGVANAPYYLAQDRGYYAAEGLDIDIKYGQVQNLLAQVADGTIAFASVSGDSMIPARLKGANITYIMALYQKNPIGALAISGNNNPPIRTPADLKGKSVGVSAPNGSTHFGLKALLKSANLTDNNVKLIAIGTTEVEALTSKRIDVAMTFLPNEAAQMNALGYKVEVLPVSDYFPLVPPGIATGDKTINRNPDLVQHFVNATLRGLKDALANPDAAFDASLKRIPELSPGNQPLQRQVLNATLEYYKAPAGGVLGSTDPNAWSQTQDFLKSIGVIDQTIDPKMYYNTKFVEQAKP